MFSGPRQTLAGSQHTGQTAGTRLSRLGTHALASRPTSMSGHTRRRENKETPPHVRFRRDIADTGEILTMRKAEARTALLFLSVSLSRGNFCVLLLLLLLLVLLAMLMEET